MISMITYDDFAKLEIRVGKIISAEKVEGADKLLKLEVDFSTEKRQVVAGIAKSYSPEELVGKQSIFIVNLEPRKIRGLESQAMIMIVKDEDEKMTLLTPEKEIKEGTKVS